MRFVHAVPGAPGAELNAGTGSDLAPLGTERFGGATSYREVPTGKYAWSLNADEGGKVLAKGKGVPITKGNWTLVAMATGMDPKNANLKVVRYRDQEPQAGTGMLRVIHACAELGKPNLQLDGRTVAKAVPFTAATPYMRVRPGVYKLAAVKPNGDPIIERRVRVRAGDATTAITMGARGMPAKVITVTDRAPKSGKGSGAATGKGSGGQGGAERTAVVRSGDSLWSIARREVGNDASSAQLAAYVDKLWARNAHHIRSGRPDVIPAGDRLILPSRRERSA